MIGAQVQITSALRAIERVRKTDGRKVFGAARKPLRADVRTHAKEQSGPSGRWPELAASTIERRARGRKRRRRRLLGRLPGAVKFTFGRDFIRGVWRARSSKVQDQGGTAGHGAKIRARPFAWMSDSVVAGVRDLYLAALARAWKRG